MPTHSHCSEKWKLLPGTPLLINRNLMVCICTLLLERLSLRMVPVCLHHTWALFTDHAVFLGQGTGKWCNVETRELSQGQTGQKACRSSKLTFYALSMVKIALCRPKSWKKVIRASRSMRRITFDHLEATMLLLFSQKDLYVLVHIFLLVSYLFCTKLLLFVTCMIGKVVEVERSHFLETSWV